MSGVEFEWAIQIQSQKLTKLTQPTLTWPKTGPAWRPAPAQLGLTAKGRVQPASSPVASPTQRLPSHSSFPVYDRRARPVGAPALYAFPLRLAYVSHAAPAPPRRRAVPPLRRDKLRQRPRPRPLLTSAMPPPAFPARAPACGPADPGTAPRRAP